MTHQSSLAVAEATSQELAQPCFLTSETSSSPNVSATKNRAAPSVASASFETLADSVFKVKCQLQQRYEDVFPDLGDIIYYVIDQEEANARKLSPDIPHLVLPALVESHMTQVGLPLLPEKPKNELGPSALVSITQNRTTGVEQFV